MILADNSIDFELSLFNPEGDGKETISLQLKMIAFFIIFSSAQLVELFLIAAGVLVDEYAEGVAAVEVVLVAVAVAAAAVEVLISSISPAAFPREALFCSLLIHLAQMLHDFCKSEVRT